MWLSIIAVTTSIDVFGFIPAKLMMTNILYVQFFFYVTPLQTGKEQINSTEQNKSVCVNLHSDTSV